MTCYQEKSKFTIHLESCISVVIKRLKLGPPKLVYFPLKYGHLLFELLFFCSICFKYLYFNSNFFQMGNFLLHIIQTRLILAPTFFWKFHSRFQHLQKSFNLVWFQSNSLGFGSMSLKSFLFGFSSTWGGLVSVRYYLSRIGSRF